jgi:hypothetical protein
VVLPLRLCVVLLNSLRAEQEQLSSLPSLLLLDVACPLRLRDVLFRARLYAFVMSFLSFPFREI